MSAQKRRRTRKLSTSSSDDNSLQQIAESKTSRAASTNDDAVEDELLSENNHDDDDVEGELIEDAEDNEVFAATLETEILKNTEREIPHFLLPKFNYQSQYEIKDFSELVDFPSFTFNAPHPIFVEPKHCNGVDLCHRLTLAKITWFGRLKGARRGYNYYMRSRRVRKLAKRDIYPVSLFNFAKRLQYDPDKYFQGLYDFYYTGGNMSTFSINDSKYIAHVGDKNLQNLRISELDDQTEPMSELRTLISTDFSMDEPIYEIQTLKSFKKNDRGIFGIRRRNQISVHSFSSEKCRLKTVKALISKETPFISFAQDCVDLNMLAVSNMLQEVRIYDLEASGNPLVNYFPMKDKEISWNSLKSYDRSLYIYAGMTDFTIIDTRTSPKCWSKNSCGLGDMAWECVNFSSLALSNFNNLLYIGSTHDLYCVDMRCLGKVIEGVGATGTVCRWTHLMNFRPIMLETYKHGQNELIALASPIFDDIRICENIQERIQEADSTKVRVTRSKKPKNVPNDRFIYKSMCLPYQPPTLEEMYATAKLNGKCLLPYADLYNRIRCCNTGMCFYGNKDDDDLKLLISTSNGDVYAEIMQERVNQDPIDRTNDNTTEVMCRYEKKIIETVPTCLNYTNIFDLSSFGYVMRWKKLDAVKIEEDEDEELKKIPKVYGSWQKPIKKLHKYKDVLAKTLLSIWDFEVEEELKEGDNDITLSSLPLSAKVQPTSEVLVNSWLEQTPVEFSINDSVMTVIPKDNLISKNLDILHNSSVDPMFAEFDLLPQSTQIMEESHNDDTRTMNTSKSILKKSKSKYVQGF